MKVPKEEVTEMMETLLNEYGLHPFARSEAVLLEASDLIYRMYEHGVDKTAYTECSVCGKQSDRKCEDTPAGGWGTMKCGVQLCGKCECGCKDEMIF